MNSERRGSSNEHHAQELKKQPGERTILPVGGNPSDTGSSLPSRSYSISGEAMSRHSEQNHSPLWRDIGAGEAVRADAWAAEYDQKLSRLELLSRAVCTEPPRSATEKV